MLGQHADAEARGEGSVEKPGHQVLVGDVTPTLPEAHRKIADDILIRAR